MSQSLHQPDDLDLLAQEVRGEAGRLVKHPIAETKRLEHVAEEGESGATPFILILGITVAAAIVIAVFVTLVFVFTDLG